MRSRANGTAGWSAPGKPTIPALTFDTDGRLWGVAGQNVFAIDVDTAEVSDRRSYGSSTSSTGSLAFNPADGLLYGSLAGRTLFSLDPDGGDRTVLTDGPVHRLAVHSSGDVFFSADSTLYRYDMPVCAANDTPTGTRPTVVVGEIDSGVTNHPTGADCTIDNLILDERPWQSHGHFLRHVSSVLGQLTDDEVITRPEANRIREAAARSDVGRQHQRRDTIGSAPGTLAPGAEPFRRSVRHAATPVASDGQEPTTRTVNQNINRVEGDSMSKYAPLREFLAEQDNEITLTFTQIALLVPNIAPSHARDSRWWINDDPSHSHCRSWGDAGFTAHPDLANGRVTFRPKATS